MCLSLWPSFLSSRLVREVARTRKLRRPIKVYKIYYKGPTGGTGKTQYRKTLHVLRRGRLITSTRSNPKLTSVELYLGRIDRGLHGYTSLRAAKRARAHAAKFGVGRRREIMVVRFIGRPKNFVAQGKFNGERSVVFTKLTVDKVVA